MKRIAAVALVAAFVAIAAIAAPTSTETNVAYWHVSTFDSAPAAYAFAAARSSRFVLQTTEDAPRFLVFFTNAANSINRGPIDFAALNDSGAALWLYHSKATATKGLMCHGGTCVVWWARD